MPQSDLLIENDFSAAVRLDIQEALQAAGSNQAGPAPPSATYAGQTFYNDSANQLFVRNGTNTSWIMIADIVDPTRLFAGPPIAASQNIGSAFQANSTPSRNVWVSPSFLVTASSGFDYKTDWVEGVANTANITLKVPGLYWLSASWIFTLTYGAATNAAIWGRLAVDGTAVGGSTKTPNNRNATFSRYNYSHGTLYEKTAAGDQTFTPQFYINASTGGHQMNVTSLGLNAHLIRPY